MDVEFLGFCPCCSLSRPLSDRRQREQLVLAGAGARGQLGGSPEPTKTETGAGAGQEAGGSQAAVECGVLGLLPTTAGSRCWLGTPEPDPLTLSAALIRLSSYSLQLLRDLGTFLPAVSPVWALPTSRSSPLGPLQTQPHGRSPTSNPCSPRAPPPQRASALSSRELRLHPERPAALRRASRHCVI